MLALNLPVNGVSFGQVSTALLREAFRKNMEPSLFLVGDSMDLSSQEEDSEFQEWLDESIIRALDSHDRENPIFKLWHINGSIESFSKNQVLLSQKNNCIYVSPIHIVKPFISSEYSCIKPFFSIFPSSSEKYILIKYTRNIRRENPSNCDIVFEESYNLNLFEKKMVMGEVYICN